MTFLDKLPTILTLAVLVGIFLALRKHSPEARVRLWTYAWALIFLHFLVQVFETHTGFAENVVESIDLGALELSGVVFVVSMSQAVMDRTRRALVLSVLIVPTAFHAVAATFDWRLRGIEVVALAVLTLAGAVFAAREVGWRSPFGIVLAAMVVAPGVWAIREQWHGRPETGMVAILALSFGMTGILFWRLVRRWSPGVLAVAGGFLAWGAVFPTAELLLARFDPNLHVNPELWNVPKFFVAIGMVFTLLEDQSRLVDEARAQEHGENLLLHRVSLVTSRLLDGRDVATLGKEITEAITGGGSFRGAALFLLRGRSLAHAGGLERRAQGGTGIVARRARTAADRGDQAGVRGGRVRWGTTRFSCARRARITRTGPAAARRTRQILIPLVSRRGAHVGGLWLSKQGNVESHESTELGELAMLATDLGGDAREPAAAQGIGAFGEIGGAGAARGGSRARIEQSADGSYGIQRIADGRSRDGSVAKAAGETRRGSAADEAHRGRAAAIRPPWKFRFAQHGFESCAARRDSTARIPPAKARHRSGHEDRRRRGAGRHRRRRIETGSAERAEQRD